MTQIPISSINNIKIKIIKNKWTQPKYWVQGQRNNLGQKQNKKKGKIIK